MKPITNAWALREVYFDENGEPTMYREPEQAQPVAVVALDTSRSFVAASHNGQVTPWTQAPEFKTVMMFQDLPLNTPLYTAPFRQPWVGLTDDEQEAVINNSMTPACVAIAINAKLKEKNT